MLPNLALLDLIYNRPNGRHCAQQTHHGLSSRRPAAPSIGKITAYYQTNKNNSVRNVLKTQVGGDVVRALGLLNFTLSPDR